ncbi:helix-turn-helix domain-containing protein [Clostridium botulinum]|uniref:helix-turn-helix domain-containing protein n=1 Tax=Clostridium botulinum TaxID=1491 RepID=UPI000773883D|nr:helix-turn-helix transcriptional regulator [Clostridium botulinum]
MKYKDLAKNIKVYRKKLGLTQKLLAEKILKSEISIRKYESGDTNIPPSTLFDICSALGISSDTLLGNDKDTYFLENFGETRENIIDSTQRALLVAHEYKAWGESFRNELNYVTTTPKHLLHAILQYLEYTEEYYSSIFVNMLNSNNDEIPYFTDEQINKIVKKVTDIVKYEIYKIENNIP